jgi:hypothetical protein
MMTDNEIIEVGARRAHNYWCQCFLDDGDITCDLDPWRQTVRDVLGGIESMIRASERSRIATGVRRYPKDICTCPYDDPCEGEEAGCGACWNLGEDDPCLGGTHKHVARLIREGQV